MDYTDLITLSPAQVMMAVRHALYAGEGPHTVPLDMHRITINLCKFEVLEALEKFLAPGEGA